MSLTVQSSFNITDNDIKQKNITTMLHSGDAVCNNFIYGVKQPFDRYKCTVAKTCLKNNYTSEQLEDVLKHLANNTTKVLPKPQENIYINNTTIEEDAWDSIEW